jgi:DNA primase
MIADQNITLSTIVRHKVALECRAAGRFVGVCPFHEERTPSFTVDDTAARFHCFGCGARGDAMDFVLRTEPLLFRALLEWLGRLEATA